MAANGVEAIQCRFVLWSLRLFFHTAKIIMVPKVTMFLARVVVV